MTREGVNDKLYTAFAMASKEETTVLMDNEGWDCMLALYGLAFQVWTVLGSIIFSVR